MPAQAIFPKNSAHPNDGALSFLQRRRSRRNGGKDMRQARMSAPQHRLIF
jgi:hypothetical protein